MTNLEPTISVATVSKPNISLEIIKNKQEVKKNNHINLDYALADILGFATIRSSFAIGSMTIQTLRVTNNPLQLSIFKTVFSRTIGTQILLNTAMASTGIGLFALGQNHVENKDIYKISAITLAQLCLMQPIYNNIINEVQDHVLNKQTRYNFFPHIKTVPFIMAREFVSIGCGFVCADKLKNHFIQSKSLSTINAGISAGCLVGLVGATLTQPIHNSVTYHVSMQLGGNSNSIIHNTKQFFKKYRLGVLTKGLFARYLMVMPTIASMNLFLSPLYDSISAKRIND